MLSAKLLIYNVLPPKTFDSVIMTPPAKRNNRHLIRLHKMKSKHPTHLPPYVQAPLTIMMASDGLLHAPPRFDMLRRPLRHLREQARSITGWGATPQVARNDDTQQAYLPPTPDGMTVSYLPAGAADARRVIFIHGSPGHATEWQPFLNDCPSDQHRIALDRPGYGDSLPATPMPSVSRQAEAIASLLEDNCIIVGYSFGGLVALQLALDHPATVAGLVLIGCPADPELEHVHPLQKLAANAFISKLLPQNLNTSNFELMELRSDMTDIAARLSELKARTTILQGLQDTLVPPSNAQFLVKHLRNTACPRLVLLPDGDHYLPWTHRDTISQAISYTIRDCG